MDTTSCNLLVICGPTASGKTALGVDLALELGGEIISADSRQVYRGFDLGSGKDLDAYTRPEGRVPVHLVDVADPGEIYSLFHYQRDFHRVFRELSDRGRLPVVVGGTGLYIEAVLQKFEVPDVPPDEEFRERASRRELAQLVAELQRRAPELAARTVLDCKRRVVRALEVARHTERHGPPPLNETDLDFAPLVLCVTWPRPELHERIRARLASRIEKGLIDEVRAILERGVDARRYDLFGMEYRHVARFVRGEISREQMVEDLLADIRYLARRQETYFRGMRKRGMELHEVPRADRRRARSTIARHRLTPRR